MVSLDVWKAPADGARLTLAPEPAHILQHLAAILQSGGSRACPRTTACTHCTPARLVVRANSLEQRARPRAASEPCHASVHLAALLRLSALSADGGQAMRLAPENGTPGARARHHRRRRCRHRGRMRNHGQCRHRNVSRGCHSRRRCGGAASILQRPWLPSRGPTPSSS